MSSRTFEVSLLDVRFHVDVPESRADLLAPYPSIASIRRPPDFQIVVRETAKGADHWEVKGDSMTICDAGLLADTLLSAVNIGVLTRTRHVAMHAGVVGFGDGAIAFPGASGAGKSTLAAACVRKGLAHVSDEALCLDVQTALVQPYLRPLALAADSSRLVGATAGARRSSSPAAKSVVSADQLGGQNALGPLTLRHIVLLTRQAGPPLLTEIPRREAFAALLRHAFNHYRMPAQTFDVVLGVVNAAQTWRLTYRSALEGAEMLRDRLANI